MMRTQGKVRFIHISSRAQKIAAGITVGLLGAWCASVGAMAVSQVASKSAQATLHHREASVEQAENRLQKYRHSIDSKTAALSYRQAFIERVVEAHISDLPARDGALESRTSTHPLPLARTDSMVSAVDDINRLEASQLELVKRLTQYADRRSKAASDAIRHRGLSPDAVLHNASHYAEGGPLDQLITSRHGEVDPRFRTMGQSLARMDALETGLASLPQVSPAHVAFISSSYGYRSDPFTGASAFHAGLDFPGPIGSPIYAAAKGKVIFAGQRQGYGNCVEISHGNGLMTRYAHLSGLRARVGQEIEAGSIIGAMGNTGRSTGSHLHFEVRIHDKPVNPRPFLVAAQTASKDTH